MMGSAWLLALAFLANGPWEMEQATAPGKWLKARVPGTVLTTLVENGVVPDPYYGLNNRLAERRIPDVLECRDFYTVTYRTRITLPELPAGEALWMRPEGINYRSRIYLNGKLVAVTAGAFARNAYEVTPYVHAGENELVVKVEPPDHPGLPEQKPWGAPGEWRNGGDGDIGRDVTILMTAGWDFMFNDGIRDRDTGIWRPIKFFTSGPIRLDHPYVKTKLNADLSAAELDLEVELANATRAMNVDATVTAEIEGTDIRLTQLVEVPRGMRKSVHFRATLENPKLWWPVNKGERNFYRVKFTVTGRQWEQWYVEDKANHLGPVEACDTLTERFAIREVRSDQSGPGGARQFYVNGRKVFIRGTNWIPEGMVRYDDARMEKEVRLTAESGVNLVRLWAGGITESDRFYELCDEYGLLVWQEFFMTGDTRHPDDRGLYLDNVAQQVKRIRNHPSVVHWVGSNESSMVEGWDELVVRLTGTQSLMMQSECDGVHDGSPYYTVNPMRYYADTASDRGSRVYGFNPEYGTCALPCYEQLVRFMPEALLWPMAGKEENWKYREGGGFNQLTKYHHLAVQAYGESASLREYAKKSQVVDALSHRALWETWNLARNRATGVLFWFNNNAVPQLGSHAWDYDLNQEASFFAQRNALEPLHAQFEYLSNRVCVVSDMVTDKQLSVRAEVYDFDTRKVWERSLAVAVPAETCVEAFAIPFAELPLGDRPHFIKLRLYEAGREIASTFYWRSHSVYSEARREEAVGPCAGGFEKLRQLPKPTVTMTPTASGVRVVNVGDRLAFCVRVKALDAKGELVVPVHYSDNYLNLLPGEAVEVVVEDLPPGAHLELETWN